MSVKDSKVTVKVPVTVLASTAGSSWVYKILATNDLGMHCVDADFSVFSILPPYNVVNAQVVRTDSTGKPRVVNDSAVTLSYAAMRDANGSINSRSRRQDQFLDVRRRGSTVRISRRARASRACTCRPMRRRREQTSVRMEHGRDGLFKAEGIPIIPTDDAGRSNRYPLMRLTATEKATGQDVAYARRRAAGVRGNDLLAIATPPAAPPRKRAASPGLPTSDVEDPYAREHPAAARQPHGHHT